MSSIDITKMSSKGQVVIPQNIRDELGLHEGEAFAVMGKDDTIVLKKVGMPSPKEVFERVHKWGVKLAKERGIKEEELQGIIERTRGR